MQCSSRSLFYVAGKEGTATGEGYVAANLLESMVAERLLGP